LIALLLLMLGIWRWLGLATALVTGTLLVFDPTFVFISALDWGVAVPSFLCRCACFYFAIRWNQKRTLRDAFFFGLFAGLGFFNKADFAVFLVAVTLAATFCDRQQLFASLRQHSSSVAVICFGFALGAGPMLLKIPRMFALTISGPHPNAPGEMTTKLKTMLSMYDGSHFYRLMNVGGVFERMYEGSSGPKAAMGIAFILICVAFCGLAYRGRIVKPPRSLFSLSPCCSLLLACSCCRTPCGFIMGS